MIEEEKIEQLIEAFYNGDTTPAEEALLGSLFTDDEIDEKFHLDRELFDAIHSPLRIPLPKGLPERLENAIDRHIGATDISKPHSSKPHSKSRKFIIGSMSLAASVLLCIGLFFVTNRQPQSDFIADTYTNPKDAAVAAEQALLFVSAKLNQGLSPLEKVKKNVKKSNKLINDHVKFN